jgi:hypothetical protein
MVRGAQITYKQKGEEGGGGGNNLANIMKVF